MTFYKKLMGIFKIDKVNASGRVLRGDIQALRALAVGLVILNHMWPKRLTGGYVGVDVFFVISGFLITSHLFRELNRNNGRVYLVKFYAKRVRRLLPVAFLVILFSMFFVWLIMPFDQWVRNVKELVFSAFYVQNLYLYSMSVDYHASNQSATVAQHYWSLSVEEQFYLLWPLLLMLFYYLAKKFNSKALFPTCVGLFGLGSFAYCVYLTYTNLAQSYFFTPVRFWEFTIGALVAVTASSIAKIKFVNSLPVALTGWILIGISAILLKPDSIFPGFLALFPVLGTAIVIISGVAKPVRFIHNLTDLPIVRLTGDISYSLYLWHWPLIIFSFYLFDVTYKHKIILIFITYFLSCLSKFFVEDKGIRSKFLSRSSFTSFVSMACVMGLIAVSGFTVYKNSKYVQEEKEKQVNLFTKDKCFGALSVDNPKCTNQNAAPISSSMIEKMNAYYALPDDCKPGSGKLNFASVYSHCNYSKKNSGKKVFIIGDSHVEQWQRLIYTYAKNNNWDVEAVMQGGCPIAKVKFSNLNEIWVKDCANNTLKIHDYIMKEKPDIIFYSSYSRSEPIVTKNNKSIHDEYVEDLPIYWKQWVNNGAVLINIADVPNVAKINNPQICLTQNSDDPMKCAVNRSDVIDDDPIIHATKKLNDPRIHVIDFTDYMCDKKVCKVSVGQVPVYFDRNHLNRTFTESLYPIFKKKIDKILMK